MSDYGLFKDYKVGDTIAVTDEGYRYSSYAQWSGIPDGFLLKRDSSPRRDVDYTVIAVGPHDTHEATIVAISSDKMRLDKKVYLMGLRGIKLVKDTKINRALRELNS